MMCGFDILTKTVISMVVVSIIISIAVCSFALIVWYKHKKEMLDQQDEER